MTIKIEFDLKDLRELSDDLLVYALDEIDLEQIKIQINDIMVQEIKSVLEPIVEEEINNLIPDILFLSDGKGRRKIYYDTYDGLIEADVHIIDGGQTVMVGNSQVKHFEFPYNPEWDDQLLGDEVEKRFLEWMENNES